MFQKLPMRFRVILPIGQPPATAVLSLHPPVNLNLTTLNSCALITMSQSLSEGCTSTLPEDDQDDQQDDDPALWPYAGDGLLLHKSEEDVDLYPDLSNDLVPTSYTLNMSLRCYAGYTGFEHAT